MIVHRPGLTNDEAEVLHRLASAWDLWVHLDDKRWDDDDEFRHAIHAAQHLVALRVARRVDRDIWT